MGTDAKDDSVAYEGKDGAYYTGVHRSESEQFIVISLSSTELDEQRILRADAPDAPFDGYPYLVTRIGLIALRHLAVLPAAWDRVRLAEVLARQATINQMATALVLGSAPSFFASPRAGAVGALGFAPLP